MNRLASYGCPTIINDRRDRDERLRVLEAECEALRSEVKRLRTQECPTCRLTHELEEAVR